MADDVKLKISRSPKNGNGWVNVIASDGQLFAYKYSGGNSGNNNGAQEFVADGVVENFNLVFKSNDSQDYEFLTFYNKNDSPDLVGTVGPNGTIVAVTDFCNTRGTFNFGVKVGVRGSNPAVSFECDPVIYNR